jgi:hypothetical protein
MSEELKATRVVVDSRRCGEGKTRDDTSTVVRDGRRVLSTWANIKNRWNIDDKCLVVLPSLALCDYYEQHLNEYISNNYYKQNHPQYEVQLRKCTSNNKDIDNVQKALHDALNDNCPIIIITQQTWTMSDIPLGQRIKYHLIIDEAIMPYKEIAVYHERDCAVDFNWKENSDLIECPESAVEWKELRIHNVKGNFITDTSEHTRTLLNSNWRNRVHYLDYEKFVGILPKNERISIIQELRPQLFDHYITIWVACAAFEYTFMRYWMDLHEIPWKIHHKLTFKPHKVPLEIRGPDDKEFTWSSYKQKNETILIDQYTEQTKPIAGDSGVLVLRNNNQKRQIFNEEVLLPHNSAGSNDYTGYEYISLESALNPTPAMSRFLYAAYGIGKERDDRVHMAQTVYTFYQTVMRSCLRTGQKATVFTLDNRVIMGLAEFFDNLEFEEIRLIRPETQSVGRPISDIGRALTGPERTFLSRKRRNEKYWGWSDEQILDLRKK